MSTKLLTILINLTLFFEKTYKNPMENQKFDDEKIIDDATAKVVTQEFAKINRLDVKKMAQVNSNLIPINSINLGNDALLRQILKELREIRQIMEISRRIRLS